MMRRSHGFTLVELMLAMAFFGSMLMISTVVFVQVLNIYNKGVAIKQMNQTGRVLTDDLLKVSNGASSLNVRISGPVRCMQIGSSVYIWGYYDDTTSTPTAYKDTNGNLIPFSRLGSAFQTCPDISASILPTDYKPLLSDAVKVYVGEIADLGNSLAKIKFVFGTYQGNTSADPSVDPVTGNVSCPASRLGSYCAFGTYETVLFSAN